MTAPTPEIKKAGAWCGCNRKPGDPTIEEVDGDGKSTGVERCSRCKGIIRAPVGHPEVADIADVQEKLRAHWAKQAEESAEVRRHLRLEDVLVTVKRVLQESEQEADSLRSWSETRVAQAEQNASRAADRAIAVEDLYQRGAAARDEALRTLAACPATGTWTEQRECINAAIKILKGET